MKKILSYFLFYVRNQLCKRVNVLIRIWVIAIWCLSRVSFYIKDSVALQSDTCVLVNKIFYCYNWWSGCELLLPSRHFWEDGYGNERRNLKCLFVSSKCLSKIFQLSRPFLPSSLLCDPFNARATKLFPVITPGPFALERRWENGSDNGPQTNFLPNRGPNEFQKKIMQLITEHYCFMRNQKVEIQLIRQVNMFVFEYNTGDKCYWWTATLDKQRENPPCQASFFSCFSILIKH